MSQLDWKNPAFLEQIEVERVEDYYKLSINGNPITFNTPLLRVPFGLDKKYNVIQIKLQCLTEEEDAMYLSYFAVMLRSRENQYYQYTIGMLDESEWASFLKSFKTLFKSPHHAKLWSFMRETFDENFIPPLTPLVRMNAMIGIENPIIHLLYYYMNDIERLMNDSTS